VSNVLIVEADAIVRNLMIRVLSRQGFTVYEAAGTEEALELCKTFANVQLDLLIADHETTGSIVTEQILDACANTKVLHISGWPYELVQEKQALVRGSSFLQKPFTASELLTTVQTLLHPRMQ
jgi:two-component system cell cycle sensor histidine kinase/response regulator CckA